MSRDRKKPPDDERLVQAAELRIQNFDWAVVGKKLHRAPNTVRRWPLKYAERWRNAMHLAERRLAIDGEAESFVVLRALLRHKNSKMRWHAAKSLVALRLDLAKIDVRMLALQRDVSTDAVQLGMELISGAPHEELASLVAAGFERAGRVPAAEAGPVPALAP